MKQNRKAHKQALALISGLLFTSLIINSISELEPSKVASIDQATYLEATEEIVNIDSSEIKEMILEEAVSTQVKDTIFTNKVDRIKTFLQSRRSPLANYAEEIVKAADTYGIDYRLVPAISIIESSGGIYTFKPYNAWGWGKTGFSNWTEAIWAVSKGLGNYYARGLNTPKKIAPSYCPPSYVSWGNKVQYIMNEIEE